MYLSFAHRGTKSVKYLFLYRGTLLSQGGKNNNRLALGNLYVYPSYNYYK